MLLIYILNSFNGICFKDYDDDFEEDDDGDEDNEYDGDDDDNKPVGNQRSNFLRREY